MLGMGIAGFRSLRMTEHRLCISQLKELVPIIMACRAWGTPGRRVRCMCGNQVVVAAPRSRTSKDTGVRLCTFSLCGSTVKGATLYGEYVDTRTNHLADDLSHNRLFCFPSKISSADHQPTPTSTHPPSQPPPRYSGRLGVSAMAPAVQRYFQEGLAPSTRRTYNAAMKRFYSFCTHCNITPFPVTEHLLCCFAAHLTDQDFGSSPEHPNFPGFPGSGISLQCQC